MATVSSNPDRARAKIVGAVCLFLSGSFAPGIAAEATISTAVKTSPPPRRVFKSVQEVIKTYGQPVRDKLKPILHGLEVAYPPKEMTWVCLKQEKALLLFARDKHGQQRQILAYPIIGASGAAGPKLKEGDLQVPEGFYRIAGFHPNVIAHLALDVNYPNEEDRAHAKAEHRHELGSDILIHGSRWSTGCLAMGNEPIEEMFVLAYDSGIRNIRLIFAPCNLLQQKPSIDLSKQPRWVPQLYKRLSSALTQYPIDMARVPPPEPFPETQPADKMRRRK